MTATDTSIKKTSSTYRQFTWLMMGLFILSLLIRLLFIPNRGFEADVAFWKSWGLAALDHGAVWTMKYTNNNYPTPFAYFLGAITWVYSLFANPHIFEEYWSNENTLFLAVAKLPSILADIGIAGIFVLIGLHAKKLGFPQSKYLYPLLAILYLLNPVSIIDGAWWGQVDSVGVFLYFLAILAALYKKPMLGGFLFIMSMMTKLQNMIYGPIYFLFLWQQFGFKGLTYGVLGAMLGFLGLNIEFFRDGDMGRVLRSLTDNFDYFPWMSLNAFNLWWIVAAGKGMDMSDKHLFLGILSAQKVGLLLFIAFYLLACLHIVLETFFRMMKPSAKSTSTENYEIDSRLLPYFFTSLAIAACSFFLFQTQSHDRYAFHLTVFLLLFTPFLPSKQQKSWIIGYILFSLLYFYNLHTALVLNYPNNGFPLLKELKQPAVTIAASYIQLGVFAFFLWYMRSRMRLLTILLPVLLVIFGCIAGNLSYVQGKPISLTTFKPLASSQDYGTRMTNMPTNASQGFHKWGPLSVQYAFYKKGIGVHANSNNVYDLNGRFSTFETDYGIDTEGGQDGSVIFVIYGDGKELFRSHVVRRFELPQHISVDVRGVKTLGLVVTDSGDGIRDDHAGWYNPKLIK